MVAGGRGWVAGGCTRRARGLGIGAAEADPRLRHSGHLLVPPRRRGDEVPFEEALHAPTARCTPPCSDAPRGSPRLGRRQRRAAPCGWTPEAPHGAAASRRVHDSGPWENARSLPSLAGRGWRRPAARSPPVASRPPPTHRPPPSGGGHRRPPVLCATWCAARAAAARGPWRGCQGRWRRTSGRGGSPHASTRRTAASSLTRWWERRRVQSRRYQHPLHAVSVQTVAGGVQDRPSRRLRLDAAALSRSREHPAMESCALPRDCTCNNCPTAVACKS